MNQDPEPQRNARPRTRPRFVYFLLFSGFLWMPPIVLYFLALKPCLLAYHAASWAETVCTIESSEIVESESPDSSSRFVFKFRPVFTYEARGQRFKASRYTIQNISFSERGEAEVHQLRYPTGSIHKCWYNPADPTQALIDREYSVPFLPVVVFSALWVVGFFGLFGVIAAYLGKGKSFF